MAAIRSVCKAFKIPQAASHIYVGVASIVKVIREQQAIASSTPAKKRARRSMGNDAPSSAIANFEDTHIPALIIVVVFFTHSHLLGAPHPEEYEAQREKAVDVVMKSVPEPIKRDMDSTIDILEGLLREAENGWLDMEWYHNLPEPATDSEETTEEVNGEITEHAEDDERPIQALEVPKRGFGSMMTDATDWLSDKRRADYKRWKVRIMKEIAQIERQEKSKGIKM
jgi:origin recognition complex subunit 6